MRKLTLAVAVLAMTLLGGAQADATTLPFEIDVANSSVTITEQNGGGIACFFTNCGIEANLAAGFGGSFALGTGDTEVFDFIEWTVDGTAGIFGRTFEVEATLAFITPDGADTTATGDGRGFFIAGVIVGGVLDWDDNDVPTTFQIPQGSTIEVDFQDGISILPLTDSVVTTAQVTGINIVPLPATLPLLATAGLGLLLLGRRRAI